MTGIRRDGNRAVGVETTRGYIGAKKIGVVAAGHVGTIMAMAGQRLPIESYPLQALVSEPIKPVLDTVVMSGQVHVYVSQSDKGELVIGASRDNYNSYAQRGSLPIVEDQLAALVELFPIVSRLRMLRQWAGIVDCAPDASPIIGLTPVDGLFINCGWGTGGFKATPGSGWVFADTIANDRPHKLNEAFSLARFSARPPHRRERRRRGRALKSDGNSTNQSPRLGSGHRPLPRLRGRVRVGELCRRMQSAPSTARRFPPPFPPPQAGEGDDMSDRATEW